MESKRILVISSCGKTKKISLRNQPTWDLLDSKSKRDIQINKFSDQLTKAGELYTGPQPNAIRKAIKILRKKCDVDHYIISAGFGLIREESLLPPL